MEITDSSFSCPPTLQIPISGCISGKKEQGIETQNPKGKCEWKLRMEVDHYIYFNVEKNIGSSWFKTGCHRTVMLHNTWTEPYRN